MKKTDELKTELKELPLDDFLSTNRDEIVNVGLSQYILALMREKKLPRKKVVADSGLQTYGYQIISGKRLCPSRDIVLRLVFAIQATREEADRILKLANRGVLYERNLRDCLIIKAIEDRLTLEEADELLCLHGQPTLSEE